MMVEEDNDPRTYFAAERTLLAWVRTGIAVIGLGFVVSRFGLFLSILRNEAEPEASLAGSTLIGIGLVVLGAFAIGLSAWQHVRFCRGLGLAKSSPAYRLSWSVWYAAVLSVVGLILAVYLTVRSATS